MDLIETVWRKSSYSGGHNECVEVASVNHFVVLRDSKDPAGPRLYFTPAEWNDFLLEVQDKTR